MAIKSPISKRLKEARLEAGLSQKQLGIAAGVDEFVASARFNQYETGKHVPDFDMVQKVARVLKVPPAYFFTIDDDLAYLIKMFGFIDKKGRRKLTHLAKQLSGDD